MRKLLYSILTKEGKLEITVVFSKDLQSTTDRFVASWTAPMIVTSPRGDLKIDRKATMSHSYMATAMRQADSKMDILKSLLQYDVLH